jgi:hypothetical protein
VSKPAPQPEVAPLLMSTTGAQEALGGIGSTLCEDLVASGDLVKVKIGRRSFITRASVEGYVARLVEHAENRTGADV